MGITWSPAGSTPGAAQLYLAAMDAISAATGAGGVLFFVQVRRARRGRLGGHGVQPAAARLAFALTTCFDV